jgi:hypothetical protein
MATGMDDILYSTAQGGMVRGHEFEHLVRQVAAYEGLNWSRRGDVTLTRNNNSQLTAPVMAAWSELNAPLTSYNSTSTIIYQSPDPVHFYLWRVFRDSYSNICMITDGVTWFCSIVCVNDLTDIAIRGDATAFSAFLSGQEHLYHMSKNRPLAVLPGEMSPYPHELTIERGALVSMIVKKPFILQSGWAAQTALSITSDERFVKIWCEDLTEATMLKLTYM